MEKGDPRPARNWAHLFNGAMIMLLVIPTVVCGFQAYAAQYNLPLSNFTAFMVSGLVFWILLLVSGETWMIATRVIGLAKVRLKLEREVRSVEIARVGSKEKESVESKGDVMMVG